LEKDNYIYNFKLFSHKLDEQNPLATGFKAQKLVPFADARILKKYDISIQIAFLSFMSISRIKTKITMLAKSQT